MFLLIERNYSNDSKTKLLNNKINNFIQANIDFLKIEQVFSSIILETNIKSIYNNI